MWPMQCCTLIGIRCRAQRLRRVCGLARSVLQHIPQTITSADLDRVLDPNNLEMTVGNRLRICILDNTQHAGQAAYLRGLIESRRVYPS